MVLQGQSLYPDIRQSGPYIHPSYPPLYPALLSLSMRWVPGLWWPGRLPAFLGYLACGILLALAGWKRWGPAVSLSPTGLLWLFPVWRTWGSMARMDTLLVTLNFAAFLLIWKLDEKPIESRKNPFPLVERRPLNAVALGMKPSACTLTLAVFFFLFGQKRFRELAAFLTAALIPVGLLTLLYQWTTHGLYLLHTIRWAATGFSGDFYGRSCPDPSCGRGLGWPGWG